jgi:DNA-binding response OmpR family regulator
MACQFETPEGGYDRAFPASTGVVTSVHVIGDDATTRERLMFALARAEFRASAFADAAAFHDACAMAPGDLVVVDVERERGLAIARALRDGNPSVGIVVLSDAGTVEARVRSFESGADAHLAKPVDPHELAAQLRALRRRLAGAARAPAHATDAWFVTQDGWILQDPRGRQMQLTTAERAFVGRLMAAHGFPASREELLESLGDNPRDADPHRIDVLVNRLRRKAATLGMALPLHAVRGQGYVLSSGTPSRPIAHELARIAALVDAAPPEIAAPIVVRPLFSRDAR